MAQFDDVMKIHVIATHIAQLLGDADGATPSTVFTLLGEYHSVTPLDLDALADDVARDQRERWATDIKLMTIGAVFAELTDEPNIHKSIYRLEQ